MSGTKWELRYLTNGYTDTIMALDAIPRKPLKIRSYNGRMKSRQAIVISRLSSQKSISSRKWHIYSRSEKTLNLLETRNIKPSFFRNADEFLTWRLNLKYRSAPAIKKIGTDLHIFFDQLNRLVEHSRRISEPKLHLPTSAQSPNDISPNNLRGNFAKNFIQWSHA